MVIGPDLNALAETLTMLSLLRLTMTGLLLALASAVSVRADDGPPNSLVAAPACAESSRLPSAPSSGSGAGDVTVTFYGVSTLMFSDGADRILIDGFVSRPGIVGLFGLRSDPGAVRLLIGPDNPPLRAILTAHAHHDHALDTAAVAREAPSAQIIGTPSLATLMRREKLESTRVFAAGDCDTFRFGAFTIYAFRVDHGPNPAILSWILDYPLEEGHAAPWWFGGYKDDQNLSFLILHGRRRILVHPSAGVRPMVTLGADTVFLGMGRVSAMVDADFYLSNLIGRETRLIVPIHWDRFTTPLGAPLEPMLFDRIPRALSHVCDPTGPAAGRDIHMMDAAAVLTLADGGGYRPSGGRHWDACTPSPNHVTASPL